MRWSITWVPRSGAIGFCTTFIIRTASEGGGSLRRLSEKDLIGMTALHISPDPAGSRAPEIEYVRSPSPPDGCHDRNGYVNRQAVECFLHHPHDGQVGRFTEWF